MDKNKNRSFLLLEENEQQDPLAAMAAWADWRTASSARNTLYTLLWGYMESSHSTEPEDRAEMTFFCNQLAELLQAADLTRSSRKEVIHD